MSAVLINSGILAFAVASAFFAIKMMYYSKLEPVCQKEFGHNQVESEKYLGEYRAFVSDVEASVQKVSNRC